MGLMLAYGIPYLVFTCFTTMSVGNAIVNKFPFEAESELAAAFLRQYYCLPEWNKTF